MEMAAAAMQRGIAVSAWHRNQPPPRASHVPLALKPSMATEMIIWAKYDHWAWASACMYAIWEPIRATDRIPTRR